jgi:UDP-glucuronate 4-epimerase
MRRSFTYVDDIVEGVIRVMDHPPSSNKSWNPSDPDPSSSKAPYKIYNLGNNSAIKLLDFIQAIEEELGKEAKKEFLPTQPGDVLATYADVSDLIADFNYKPAITLKEGIKKSVSWYKNYYEVR